MTMQWILGWWNLIFLVRFGLALAYLGVYTLSGWTFGDADVDADAHVDADVDVHIDADVGAHVDVDHDIDHDVDHDADHDTQAETPGSAQPSSILIALSWIGLGKVPVSILLMVLAMTWGF